MTTREEDLQARVRRAKASRSRPMVGTMRTARADGIRAGGMSDAAYRRLVAQDGKQAWSSDDEIALRERVRRLR